MSDPTYTLADPSGYNRRPPVVPLRMTELGRQEMLASHPELLAAGELCRTTDEERLWQGATLLGPKIHHGTVADEAEMLALVSTTTRGVYAGDTCYRVDAQCEFRCIAVVDDVPTWQPSSIAGLTTVTEETSTSFRLILGTGVTVTEETTTSFRLIIP